MKPTDEADNDRVLAALLQFERGKWANVSQPDIPPSVIRAALSAFDPTQKLTFNPWKRTGGTTGNRVSNGGRRGKLAERTLTVSRWEGIRRAEKRA